MGMRAFAVPCGTSRRMVDRGSRMDMGMGVGTDMDMVKASTTMGLGLHSRRHTRVGSRVRANAPIASIRVPTRVIRGRAHRARSRWSCRAHRTIRRSRSSARSRGVRISHRPSATSSAVASRAVAIPITAAWTRATSRRARRVMSSRRRCAFAARTARRCRAAGTGSRRRSASASLRLMVKTRLNGGLVGGPAGASVQDCTTVNCTSVNR